MSKSKKKLLAEKPLKRKDVENAFSGQSLVINRKLDQLRQEMVTKKEAEKFTTKEDLKDMGEKLERKQEQDKKSILAEIDKRREQDKKDILDGVKTMMEVRDDELQGKHEAELDRVAGKADAPPAWKTIPRRLKTVEMDVEKIKDHLEIS